MVDYCILLMHWNANCCPKVSQIYIYSCPLYNHKHENNWVFDKIHAPNGEPVWVPALPGLMEGPQKDLAAQMRPDSGGHQCRRPWSGHCLGSLHAFTVEHCAALAFHSCHLNKVTFYFNTHTWARANTLAHTHTHARMHTSFSTLVKFVWFSDQRDTWWKHSSLPQLLWKKTEINVVNGKDSFAHRHRKTSAFHSCTRIGCLLSSVWLHCSFFFPLWLFPVRCWNSAGGLKTFANVQLNTTV